LTEAFLHGFLLALGLILPLGVQNVFIFNQGAVQPTFWRATPAVLTASLCDTILILLAVLGVSLLVLSLVWVKTILLVFGILFLLYMGWVTWNSSGIKQQEEKAFSHRKQITFAASVSLLNPHAIMDTIGVIGSSSIQYDGSEKWIFTISCIMVSWLWFFGLALCGRIMKKMDQSGKLIFLLNRVSAVIIWGTAGYLLYQIFTSVY
jgi:L-lysine exporter family protein LysE/ArgO